MDGLTFIDGQTRETIEQKLHNAEIEFYSSDVNNSPFFRRTAISIQTGYKFGAEEEKLDFRKLIEILDFPGYFKSRSFYYYARYKMEDGFDVNQLDGKLTFDNGFLVESICIDY
jgi:hypothetical protein